MLAIATIGYTRQDKERATAFLKNEYCVTAVKLTDGANGEAALVDGSVFTFKVGTFHSR
jgi:hypothetical protein